MKKEEKTNTNLLIYGTASRFSPYTETFPLSFFPVSLESLSRGRSRGFIASRAVLTAKLPTWLAAYTWPPPRLLSHKLRCCEVLRQIWVLYSMKTMNRVTEKNEMQALGLIMGGRNEQQPRAARRGAAAFSAPPCPPPAPSGARLVC